MRKLTRRPLLAALALSSLASGLGAGIAPIAHAEPRGVRVARLGAEGSFRPGPVHARVGERVELTVELVDGRRRRPLGADARVRFERITPHMQHVAEPPPNAGIAQYANSVLFGPEHGRWLGYDTIEYDVVAMERVTATSTLVVTEASGPNGAGTVFFAAEVMLGDGRVLRTADASARDALGLSSDVMRISFRDGDDYLGWLSTYFLVPNVFGSTGAQADRYLGADCADVLVGARRASGARGVRYTSVTGIASVATPITETLVLAEDGVVRDEAGERVVLRWRDGAASVTGLAPGDLVAIDYVGAGSSLPRAWDHIGALVRDVGAGEASGVGVLDGDDVLRHMTPRGLLDQPLREQAPIRFRVWRFRR